MSEPTRYILVEFEDREHDEVNDIANDLGEILEHTGDGGCVLGPFTRKELQEWLAHPISQGTR